MGLSAGPLPTPPWVPRLPLPSAVKTGTGTTFQDSAIHLYEPGRIRTIPTLTLLLTGSCDKVWGRR